MHKHCNHHIQRNIDKKKKIDTLNFRCRTKFVVDFSSGLCREITFFFFVVVFSSTCNTTPWLFPLSFKQSSSSTMNGWMLCLARFVISIDFFPHSKISFLYFSLIYEFLLCIENFISYLVHLDFPYHRPCHHKSDRPCC